MFINTKWCLAKVNYVVKNYLFHNIFIKKKNIIIVTDYVCKWS